MNLQRRRAEEQRLLERKERKIRRRRMIIREQVLIDLARTDPKYGGNRRSNGRLREGIGGYSSSTQDGLVGNKPNEWPETELLALVEGLEKFTGKLQQPPLSIRIF
jgi:hypothetical protein